MKVLLFGSKGFLGQEFLKVYPDAACPLVDIADSLAVSAVFEQEKPDVVINAAGKTGKPNIDWCETHRIETVRGNVTGPLVLLEECVKRNLYWVHLSSGCIYDGDNGGRGFSEEDPSNFTGSFYSRSKAAVDQVLKEFAACPALGPEGSGPERERSRGILILRLRMPFDSSKHERNLIVKLLKYPKVLDVQNSLTYLPDFLEASKVLIEQRRVGIFNIVNPGTISPYEVMMLYKKVVRSEHHFERLTIEDLPTVVRAGRSNCVLSTAKIEEEGIHLPDVHQRMKEAMVELHASLSSSPTGRGLPVRRSFSEGGRRGGH